MHLPVETTWAQQRWIKHVRSVSCGNDNDSIISFESIHFNKQLIQSLFTLIVASTKSRAEAINPLNNFFRTADGQWFVAVPRQGADDWPRFARAIGAPELIEDARFNSIRQRRANGPELVALLDAGFGAMRWEEVEAALTREKLVFSPVLSVAQTTQDPQANAAGCYAMRGTATF